MKSIVLMVYLSGVSLCQLGAVVKKVFNFSNVGQLFNVNVNVNVYVTANVDVN